MEGELHERLKGFGQGGVDWLPPAVQEPLQVRGETSRRSMRIWWLLALLDCSSAMDAVDASTPLL